MYFEAKSEPRKGKIAVALVTLNRVKDKRYPKSICGVVYQRNQFSWTKKYSNIKINSEQWEKSREAAVQALMDGEYLGNFQATHFHAEYVNPNWKLRRVAKIGKHIFYA